MVLLSGNVCLLDIRKEGTVCLEGEREAQLAGRIVEREEVNGVTRTRASSALQKGGLL